MEVPAQEQRASAGVPGSATGARVPSRQYDRAVGALKVENGEMRPDVAWVAIDGRKWIASRFHPNLISEKLIGNITHHEANIQDQHLAALKSVVEKRKRQFKEEEKAKKVDET